MYTHHVDNDEDASDGVLTQKPTETHAVRHIDMQAYVQTYTHTYTHTWMHT